MTRRAWIEVDERPVKERDDPVSCQRCGRPTWSATGICSPCRNPPAYRIDTSKLPSNVFDDLPAQPTLDEVGRLADDAPCRRCGYNLRGLPPDSACPECELPISRSMFGDWLRFADPAWLGRVNLGVRLVLAAVLGSVGLFFFGMLSMILSGGGMIGLIALLTVIAGALILLGVVGVWLLTSPDPGQAENEPPVSVRTIARWCMPMLLLSAVTGLLSGRWSGQLPTTGMSTSGVLLLLAGIVLGITGLIGVSAVLLHLSRLAERIPAPSVARQMRILAWGYIITAGTGQAVGAGMTMLITSGGFNPMTPSPMFVLLSMGDCLSAVARFVVAVWVIVLLFFYVTALGRAQCTAEQIAAHQSLPDRLFGDSANDELKPG